MGTAGSAAGFAERAAAGVAVVADEGTTSLSATIREEERVGGRGLVVDDDEEEKEWPSPTLSRSLSLSRAAGAG